MVEGNEAVLDVEVVVVEVVVVEEDNVEEYVVEVLDKFPSDPPGCRVEFLPVFGIELFEFGIEPFSFPGRVPLLAVPFVESTTMVRETEHKMGQRMYNSRIRIEYWVKERYFC